MECQSIYEVPSVIETYNYVSDVSLITRCKVADAVQQTVSFFSDLF
jgi:hypothetical protein